MISSHTQSPPPELTSEQKHAVNLALTQEANLKISALAGTGKTTTLRAIASRLPQHRILYIAFNKTVQMEAEQSFPPNVQARTIHSLAYRELGIFDERWKAKLAGRWTLRDYATFLNLSLRSAFTTKALSCLKEALKIFQQSCDLQPSSIHIPLKEWKEAPTPSQKEALKIFVDAHAPILWDAMKDPRQISVPISHDTYLKLWQLSNPVIRNVHIILLDEAQDANPVMIDILKKQKSRLILVGDSWQQIYSFRGAINAMEDIQTPLHCSLTQSFRFGEPVAHLANSILSLCPSSLSLKGNPKQESRLGPLTPNLPYTLIFRSNMGLLEEAWDLAAKSFRIYIEGSLDQMTGLLCDVFYLFIKEKRKIKDPKLRGLRNWKELTQNISFFDDMELNKCFRFVERYTHSIPSIIDNIRKAAVSHPRQSQVILITGHKSKGQEWSHVRISEDFLDALRSQKREELNLLYVACTRARSQLEVPMEILEVLKN